MRQISLSIFIILVFSNLACDQNKSSLDLELNIDPITEIDEKSQEEIIELYLKNGAWKDCFRKLGKTEEAEELQKLGEINGRAGNAINEDNVLYERYPYQIRWY